MKLHFISGLPRSGSTLLAALLRQNPRFHAGMSSPVAHIVMRVQHATSRGSEGAVFIGEEQRKRILRGIVANYYVGKQIVFDTNRAWCAKMPLIAELFPDAKVICCVRDVSWIMNSIEKIIQSNPLELSGIFNYQTNGTVFSRVNGLAAADGMVGYAMNALREAYYGPFADRLMLLDYEALARDPRKSVDLIYDFIGQSHFEHDFENLQYAEEEFDSALGTPGLHRVCGPIKWQDQKSLLPPEIMQRFSGDAFWRDQSLNSERVSVVMWGKSELKAVA